MHESKRNTQPNTQKPVPDETGVIPALDATRRRDANLAPQGSMHPDGPRDTDATPEGDNEVTPTLPPSATDPE